MCCLCGWQACSSSGFCALPYGSQVWSSIASDTSPHSILWPCWEAFSGQQVSQAGQFNSFVASSKIKNKLNTHKWRLCTLCLFVKTYTDEFALEQLQASCWFKEIDLVWFWMTWISTTYPSSSGLMECFQKTLSRGWVTRDFLLACHQKPFPKFLVYFPNSNKPTPLVLLNIFSIQYVISGCFSWQF